MLEALRRHLQIDQVFSQGYLNAFMFTLSFDLSAEDFASARAEYQEVKFDVYLHLANTRKYEIARPLSRNALIWLQGMHPLDLDAKAKLADELMMVAVYELLFHVEILIFF